MGNRASLQDEQLIVGAAAPPALAAAPVDLYLCPQGPHNVDLARALRSELEAMRPRARIALGGQGDPAKSKPAIQTARCFALLLSSRDFANKAALRELVFAAQSRRKILIVWDKERLPTFPTVDGGTALPAVEDVAEAELRALLQAALRGTVLVFFREAQYRLAGLREIAANAALPRCARPHPRRPPPARALAPATAAALILGSAPVTGAGLRVGEEVDPAAEGRRSAGCSCW
eukprot:tig00021133_g18902.t1